MAPGVSIALGRNGHGEPRRPSLGHLDGGSPQCRFGRTPVKQAHPKLEEGWSIGKWRSSTPPIREGEVILPPVVPGPGSFRAAAAGRPQVVALVCDRGHGLTLNYGYAELDGNSGKKARITLTNLGSSAATFAVADAPPRAAAAASLEFLERVRSGRRRRQRGRAAQRSGSHRRRLELLPRRGRRDRLHTVRWLEQGCFAEGAVLSRPSPPSEISTTLDSKKPKSGSTTATITNKGVSSGAAELHAWGLQDKKGKRPGLRPPSVGGRVVPGATGVSSFRKPG